MAYAYGGSNPPPPTSETGGAALAELPRLFLFVGVWLCVVVGTSAVVQPAAGLVVNPERTGHADAADWVLPAKAGDALPALLDAAF